MPQDELFKNESPADSPISLWIPTNEENLRQILSSTLLRTREGYCEKYYSDILAACPGRIPLFAKAVTAELLSEKNSPQEPVAVIIRLREEAARFADRNQPVSFIDHPLPASMIDTVFFAAREDRDNWQSLAYDNLDPATHTLKENRTLFKKTVQGQKEAFTKATKSVADQEPEVIPNKRYRQADVIAGVIAALYLQEKPSLRILERLQSFFSLSASDEVLTEAGKILSESGDQSESKLITVILQALMENGPMGLGEETFGSLERFIEAADFEPKHRSALFEQINRLKDIITNSSELSRYLTTYYKSGVLRGLLLFLNYKEESEILRTDFPDSWNVSKYEQFLALCFRNSWRGWSLLNAPLYKRSQKFNDLIGRWMCNLVAGKELFELSTDFLKSEWLAAFWKTANFEENKKAETFALRIAVEQNWRCEIKHMITIPEQKWFFLNNLSWRNRFKIEVRDAIAEIELSYNSEKLRQALLSHTFSGELLEEALRLIP